MVVASGMKGQVAVCVVLTKWLLYVRLSSHITASFDERKPPFINSTCVTQLAVYSNLRSRVVVSQIQSSEIKYFNLYLAIQFTHT